VGQQCRCSSSVAGPFVCRCLTSLTGLKLSRPAHQQDRRISRIRKPVPIHPPIVEALAKWIRINTFESSRTGYWREFSPWMQAVLGAGGPAGGRRSLESKRISDGTRFDTILDSFEKRRHRI
jgi:hypothetical protein